MAAFTYRTQWNELADKLAKEGTKIIKKNNKIPLISVKTLIKTKSDLKTKKQQTKIAQSKICKNIGMLWDRNQSKSRNKQ